MSKNSKFIIAFVLLGATVSTGILYRSLTDGFQPSHVQSSFIHRENWQEPPLSPDKQKKVNTILKEHFSYLGRGAQSYAFVSKSGKYVLKIINQMHFKLPRWKDMLYRALRMEKERRKGIARREKRIHFFLSSSTIAYENLREETGILYLHLNRTNHLPKPVTVIDKRGVSHFLDPNNIDFLLQKKAELIAPFIIRCMKEGNKIKAKRQIMRLIAFLIRISKKGIAETDKNLMINAGFVDDQPIFIDIGRFVKDKRFKKKEVYQKDVIKRTLPLKKWLRSHYPTLVPTLEKSTQSPPL